jgi:hypothetical protein
VCQRFVQLQVSGKRLQRRIRKQENQQHVYLFNPPNILFVCKFELTNRKNLQTLVEILWTIPPRHILSTRYAKTNPGCIFNWIVSAISQFKSTICQKNGLLPPKQNQPSWPVSLLTLCKLCSHWI